MAKRGRPPKINPLTDIVKSKIWIKACAYDLQASSAADLSRKARKDVNLVADKSDSHTRLVQAYMKGDRVPTLMTVQKISDACNNPKEVKGFWEKGISNVPFWSSFGCKSDIFKYAREEANGFTEYAINKNVKYESLSEYIIASIKYIEAMIDYDQESKEKLKVASLSMAIFHYLVPEGVAIQSGKGAVYAFNQGYSLDKIKRIKVKLLRNSLKNAESVFLKYNVTVKEMRECVLEKHRAVNDLSAFW